MSSTACCFKRAFLQFASTISETYRRWQKQLKLTNPTSCGPYIRFEQELVNCGVAYSNYMHSLCRNDVTPWCTTRNPALLFLFAPLRVHMVTKACVTKFVLISVHIRKCLPCLPLCTHLSLHFMWTVRNDCTGVNTQCSKDRHMHVQPVPWGVM